MCVCVRFCFVPVTDAVLPCRCTPARLISPHVVIKKNAPTVCAMTTTTIAGVAGTAATAAVHGRTTRIARYLHGCLVYGSKYDY